MVCGDVDSMFASSGTCDAEATFQLICTIFISISVHYGYSTPSKRIEIDFFLFFRWSSRERALSSRYKIWELLCVFIIETKIAEKIHLIGLRVSWLDVGNKVIEIAARRIQSLNVVSREIRWRFLSWFFINRFGGWKCFWISLRVFWIAHDIKSLASPEVLWPSTIVERWKTKHLCRIRLECRSMSSRRIMSIRWRWRIACGMNERFSSGTLPSIPLIRQFVGVKRSLCSSIEWPLLHPLTRCARTIDKITNSFVFLSFDNI